MLKYPGPFPKKKWTAAERDQLASLTKQKIVKLLAKDPRWEQLHIKGARYVFRNSEIPSPYDFLTIHYHKERFRNRGLLLHLIDHICWTNELLVEWKVLK